LLDTGASNIALKNNMEKLKINPNIIDSIIISHGHYDHTSGLMDLLKDNKINVKSKLWNKKPNPDNILNYVNSKKFSVIVNPAYFRERWKVTENKDYIGPRISPNKEEIEIENGKIKHSKTPYKLCEDAYITGTIPRKSFEKTSIETAYYREDNNFIKDNIEDDQAIVINVKDKGLIIISGCAHSGIINTINCAKKITNIDRIYGIIGGFHLADKSKDEIDLVINEINKLDVKIVVPLHCSGFNALNKFFMRVKGFENGVTGTSIYL
jgi:7,8-dihydropterin-6-yl-methyl-4-(beta-D-ribofuranosyl)aminobenzene 5'-phosphate synthase